MRVCFTQIHATMRTSDICILYLCILTTDTPWLHSLLTRNTFCKLFETRETVARVEASAMKRSLAFVDDAAVEKLDKMLRSTRSLFHDQADCFASLQELQSFKEEYAVFVTMEGKVADIPLPPNVVFHHGQLVDKFDETTGEESMTESEADDWLRQNIREAGIKVSTKIYDKMNGVQLFAEIEHDTADYDTWDCCDDTWGNKATFLVSCAKKTNNKNLSLLCPPPLIVRYDVIGGCLKSNLFTDAEWDRHKFLLG